MHERSQTQAKTAKTQDSIAIKKFKNVTKCYNYSNKDHFSLVYYYYSRLLMDDEF